MAIKSRGYVIAFAHALPIAPEHAWTNGGRVDVILYCYKSQRKARGVVSVQNKETSFRRWCARRTWKRDAREWGNRRDVTAINARVTSHATPVTRVYISHVIRVCSGVSGVPGRLSGLRSLAFDPPSLCPDEGLVLVLLSCSRCNHHVCRGPWNTHSRSPWLWPNGSVY